MKSTSTRCALLDELRGLDLISMMLYHGMWDLVYLFGVRAPWYGLILIFVITFRTNEQRYVV